MHFTKIFFVISALTLILANGGTASKIGIRCGDLQARRSCKSTKNYINVYSPSLRNCLKACTEESKGTPGCCEYQVDWKKCVFVPGDIGIRTASTGGAVNRYATQCSYQDSCGPPKNDADPRVVSYGKHCRGSCINGNIGYTSLSKAWKKCFKVPDCGFIMRYSNGRYYLRRNSDRNASGFKGYLVTCDNTCGVRPTIERIPGGKETTLPWQVYIPFSGQCQATCGGTLISPRHVLTAAHCNLWETSTVVVGEHSRTNESDGTIHEFCRYENHPDYSRNDNYDFAIVHLKNPVEIGPQAIPACLPTAAMHRDNFFVGKTLTTSGWGTMDYGEDRCPDKLHAVNVTGVSNRECKERYSKIGKGHQIRPESLCAGDTIDGGEDSCQGDSGGPLTYNYEGHETVVGVVSWGEGFADKRYSGVYARVTEALPRIEEQLTKTR